MTVIFVDLLLILLYHIHANIYISAQLIQASSDVALLLPSAASHPTSTFQQDILLPPSPPPPLPPSESHTHISSTHSSSSGSGSGVNNNNADHTNTTNHTTTTTSTIVSDVNHSHSHSNKHIHNDLYSLDAWALRVYTFLKALTELKAWPKDEKSIHVYMI